MFSEILFISSYMYLSSDDASFYLHKAHESIYEA